MKEYKINNGLKIFFFFAIFFFLFLVFSKTVFALSDDFSFWKIQSIDTMKSSRDLAREKLNDSSFDQHIRQEVKLIKESGAGYIALDTPYDEEFYPYLLRWVKISRENGLSVWFRGNWSGWEGWFEYPKTMTREEHLAKTKNFILSHPELFQDEDSFTACPECEYGGPGSPLQTRDFIGFRKFMTDEYKMMNDAFAQIGKKVNTNWFSMNPDVAKEVLDADTVTAIGNLITLDYYVKDTKQMKDGLDFFAQKFPQAKIFLGEFGAPIPDINGNMTDEEQENFVRNIFHGLSYDKKLAGVNYWVSWGGSTALFTSQLEPKKVTDAMKDYFIPGAVSGTVTNTLGERLSNIPVETSDSLATALTDGQGGYKLILPAGDVKVTFGNAEYIRYAKEFSLKSGTVSVENIVLSPKHPGIVYKIKLFFKKIADYFPKR